MDHALTRRLDTWLHNTETRPPPALILGSWSQSLSFARSLGRRGVPLLILDSVRFLGGYTRHAAFLQLRPPDECPADWLEALEYLGARLPRRAALFVMSDALCRLVARHQRDLASAFNFVMPDPAVVEMILDKRNQYIRADQLGIPIPKTFFPESEQEARQVSAEVAYPCLLKPRTSYLGIPRLGKKVWVIHSADELVDALARVTTSEARFMVQEIVPGDCTTIVVYLGFWDRQGGARLEHLALKLREYPPRYGTGSFFVTADVPQVLESSRRLLRAFNYRGFVGVEMKRDARDGIYRLIEINPRAESLTAITVAAGVDLPWLAYQYLNGNDLFSKTELRVPNGVKFVDEQLDVQTFLEMRRAEALSLGGWLGSLRGAKPAIAAWDDPAPLLVGLGRAVQSKLNNHH